MSDYLFFQLKSANIGSILVEFVFCVPVIIILLFFVNDHFRYYELKSKVKTSAYLAASMIQQIGNTRSNKQLTMTDLKRISFASYMNLFHTNSMYSPYPFGIHPRIAFFYIKRDSSNSYTYQISYVFLMNSYSTSYISSSCFTSTDIGKTSTEISTVHPDLVCNNDGDERVMIWSTYIGSEFNKSKLGFFVLPLNIGTRTSFLSFPPAIHSPSTPFQHKVVFTPKPGLFPVKNE